MKLCTSLVGYYFFLQDEPEPEDFFHFFKNKKQTNEKQTKVAISSIWSSKLTTKRKNREPSFVKILN